MIPPAPGSTAHAGVTVRYLAAEPPLDPLPAGSRALVYVDSRQRPYTWTLTRAGARKPSAQGAGRGFELRVPLPPRSPGLYVLLRSGVHQTAVPLVARAPGHGGARLLVVLPALTWQGQNPVDDDDDGLPNTLDAGGPIELGRAFANGLPAGLADEQALLAYLDRSHLPYDLTTDLGLIDGTGPTLAGHTGIVLAGSERWLPSTLGAALRGYVLKGGKVLSLGIDSLRRGVSVELTAQAARAVAPTQPAAADLFGAKLGTLVTGSKDLIGVARDGLGIFTGTAGAFPGFSSYQPIPSIAAPAQVMSVAGTTDTLPSIVGYRLGQGVVVEIGLPGFGSSLVHNVDAQELVNQLWKVLSG